MYLCKVIKKDVNSEKCEISKENISKHPNKLLLAAKNFAQKFYNEKDKDGYTRRLTPFIELNWIKKITNTTSFPDHTFYYGAATVFDNRGKPLWIITISINIVEMIK